MGLLEGKKALVVGIASKHSIATGIARALHEQGAELALTYQNEKLLSRVEGFAQEWNSNLVLPCDVTDDDQIADLSRSSTRNGVGWISWFIPWGSPRRGTGRRLH